MNRPTDPPAVPPLVLVAGAASRDLDASDPRGWRLGGAVTYASLALARLGMRVGAVVGVDEEAAGAHELATLEASGVVVSRARLASGPVFELDESPHGRRIHCIATSAPLPVTEVPRAWLTQGTPALLGPVAGELGADWVAVGGDEVALGWQGLLRVLRAGEAVERTPPAAHPLLGMATLVVLSREDVAADVTLAELAGFLPIGATLVSTNGERGGDVVRQRPDADATDAWRYPAVPSDQVMDSTGAGDVFLAAMLAARVDPSLGPDVLVAAAAASLAVEGRGLDAVPRREAVLERMRRAESLASRWESDDSSLAVGRPSQA